MAVIEDLVKDAGLDETAKGQNIVRAFHVDELTPGPGIWTEARQQLAAYGVGVGMPHPTAAGLVCTRLKADPFLNSRTKVRPIAQYSPYSVTVGGGGKIIRFRSFNQQTRTSRYPDGSLIKVSYTPPGGDQSIFQLATVSATKAYGELIIERQENSNPEARIKFQNKLNSGNFRGQPKWTWLCTNVDIDPEEFGWFVRYRFAYDEETWIKPAFFIVEATGQPPSDVFDNYDKNTAIGDGKGYVNALVNGETNFNALGF